jgi:hypothetical protein
LHFKIIHMHLHCENRMHTILILHMLLFIISIKIIYISSFMEQIKAFSSHDNILTLDKYNNNGFRLVCNRIEFGL